MQLHFDEVRFNERTSSRGLAASAAKSLLKYDKHCQLPLQVGQSSKRFHWNELKKAILPKAHSASGEAVMEFFVQRPESTKLRVCLQTSSLCSKQERNPTQGLPPKLQARCLSCFLCQFSDNV